MREIQDDGDSRPKYGNYWLKLYNYKEAIGGGGEEEWIFDNLNQPEKEKALEQWLEIIDYAQQHPYYKFSEDLPDLGDEDVVDLLKELIEEVRDEEKKEILKQKLEDLKTVYDTKMLEKESDSNTDDSSTEIISEDEDSFDNLKKRKRPLP